MLDLHSHILPKIDDGSSSVTESIIMADQSAASGVKVLAATPHITGRELSAGIDGEVVKEGVKRFSKLLTNENIKLTVVPGMEILADEKTAEYLKTGKLITLNGTKYALVEFSFSEDPSRVLRILKSILNAGFVPVVAHPERYFFVHDDLDILATWRRIGCILQLDKGSALGKLGRPSYKVAQYMLQNGLVHLVASDAHDSKGRNADMDDIRTYLIDTVSISKAKELLRLNPLAVVTNRELGSIDL